MMTWMQTLTELPATVVVLIKMTLLLGVGWLVHFALAQKNPRWRVFVWRGVILGLMLLPVVEIVLPKLQVAVPVPRPAVAVEPPVITYEPYEPTAAVRIESRPVLALEKPESFSVLAWTRERIIYLVCTAWSLVTLVLATRIICTTRRVRRAVRTARPSPKRVRRLLEQVAADVRCRARVDIRTARGVASPFLAGLFRPVIVLPERLTDEQHGEELPAVLAHELAHLQSHDLVWICVLKWLSVLLWFHPLTWKIRSAHATACEQVCDAVAADYAGGVSPYSQTLARLALELVVNAPAPAGLPMIRSAEISRRLRTLKRGIHAAALARPWVLTSILCGSLILVTLGCLKLVTAEGLEINEPLTAQSQTAGFVSDRLVRFPEDRSMGWLAVREPGMEAWRYWEQLAPARGTVTVPAGKELQLAILGEAAADLSPLAALGPDDIQELYLGWTGLEDDELAHITGLTGMHSLSLSAHSSNYSVPNQITGEGLKHLEELVSLRNLGLFATQIDDDGLEPLRELKSLEHLLIGHLDNMTGEGLVNLKDLPSLKEISFYMTPITDDGLASLRGHKTLESLSLQYTDVTDDGLAHLKTLPKLKEFVLPPETTDEGLANLAGAPSLETLSLSDTAVSDDGLGYLKTFPALKSVSMSSMNRPNMTGSGLVHLREIPTLEEISVSIKKITDAELAHLSGLKTVKSLHLGRTAVTDAGLAHIRGLTDLDFLSLADTQITDAGLTNLEGMKVLTSLRLRNTLIGDAGMAHMAGLTSLEDLWLQSTDITDEGLVHLKNMHKLSTLYLSNTRITDEGLAHLKELTSLNLLNIDRTPITDAGLVHLKDLSLNYQLSLSDTDITDEGLRHLTGLTSLKKLFLRETQVTEKGVEELRKALPDCEITYESRD